MELQVSRIRASRLPGYSAAVTSSRNAVNRTQSTDRKPVITTTATTLVKQQQQQQQQHGGRSVDTHCGRSHPDTSRDPLTSSTVIDADVISADMPPAVTANTRLDGEQAATKQAMAKGKAKASHLRPPKTIVARPHRHQSNDAASAADTSAVPARHGMFLIRQINKTSLLCFVCSQCGWIKT